MPEFIQIFHKISLEKDEILKYLISKPFINNQEDVLSDKYLFENNKRILYALDEKEIELIKKFIIVSKMLPDCLYTLGIFVKCLNDDARPNLTPGNILEVLNNIFDFNWKDFVVLTLNKVTFAKMQCDSANFGEIDYMLRKDVKLENDLIHFSLRTNLELNRMFYINGENIIKDREEILEKFMLSMRNTIDHSFYFFSLKNNPNKFFKLKRDQSLNESEEIDMSEKEIVVKLIIPSFLLDFENSSNRFENSKKIFTKFKSKIVVNYYLDTEIKYHELLIKIKKGLFDIIDHSKQRFQSDLEKRRFDLSNENFIEITVEDKSYVNYNDSIEFVYDTESFRNYQVKIENFN